MSQLLISEEYLKARSVIDNNVDMAQLTPIIEFVQDLIIEPEVLGTKLLNILLVQSTAPTSLTSANELLLNKYVLKCMLLYIMAKSPMVFKFRYMNKGIMVKSSDNSQPADTADIYKLADFWKNMAEAYAEKAKNFIKANPDDYAEYFTNTAIDEQKPANTAFETDIYLPEPRCWDGKERY